MTQTELEQRVRRLEAEVVWLKSHIDTAKNKKDELPWWKKIRGTFADDEAHEEAMRLGREYRLAQRTPIEDDEENGDS